MYITTDNCVTETLDLYLRQRSSTQKLWERQITKKYQFLHVFLTLHNNVQCSLYTAGATHFGSIKFDLVIEERD